MEGWSRELGLDRRRWWFLFLRRGGQGKSGIGVFVEIIYCNGVFIEGEVFDQGWDRGVGG